MQCDKITEIRDERFDKLMKQGKSAQRIERACPSQPLYFRSTLEFLTKKKSPPVKAPS